MRNRTKAPRLRELAARQFFPQPAWPRAHYSIFFAALSAVGGLACGSSAKVETESDAAAETSVTTEHCSYEPVSGTAGAGGTVTEAPLFAGAAEAIVDIPVGTALGAYTARAGFLGTAGKVDLREVPISGSFNPSLGIESAPRVKALYLGAGADRVVLVRIDLGLVYEGLLFDLEERLGADYHGKVIISASHSHSAWGQHSGSFVFQVGTGPFRELVYERQLDAVESVVRQAVDTAEAAQIGIASTGDFDPEDRITRDRRSENDALMDGAQKDRSMFMIRVDRANGGGIAALPVYGVHGTLLGADNSFASGDAPGGVERLLEEEFDEEVVVMHLQGAGGDVSPRGYGSLDCEQAPGAPDDPCFPWLKIEGHARVALPALTEAYAAAGADMKSSIALEMMTQSIETGPSAETFAVREGALSYAAFDGEREADRVIFDETGDIASPIDEFNAPVGAALCEADNDDPATAYPLFPLGLMPGTAELPPYGACVRVDTAADILGTLLKLETETVDATHPVCQSTRTTVSALRLGEFLVGTMPGELTVMLADSLRAASPAPPEKTILLGYAQGHVGYCLTAEDWLQGGYEPSINVWGPLEGEYVAEQLAALFPLAMSSEREDAASRGADRVATNRADDGLIIDSPAPMAGTVPDVVPERVWRRTGPSAIAQPAATIPRVSGIASFVWIGDDPHEKTPEVTLEREVAEGVFETVRRHSGRPVRSADILLSHTPQPLRREGNEPQTHYWTLEWQAVPWTGAVALGERVDGLDRRAEVPLGRYRFRVRGLAYDLASEPFTVVPAVFEVAANADATTLDIDVALNAPTGYRLLDLSAPSNRPVPLRNAALTVSVDTNGGPFEALFTTSSEGRIAIPLDDLPGSATEVTVSDSHGNAGHIEL